MNKLVIVIVIVIVGLGGWFVFRPDDVSNKPIDKQAIVVAFGDSLVEGVGADKDKNFVALLSQRLGIEIINEGVSGDTTAGGVARLERDVLSKNPDVVIVLLGGNDALRRTPEDQTFANLENIITQIQNRGAKVLLLGVRGGIFGDSYKKKYEDLADKKNIEHVSDVLSGLFADKRYMYDPIHPNAAGYEKIADKVEPVLREILAE